MSSAAAHHVTFAPELDPATPDTTDSEESDVDILDVLNESLDVVAMEKLQAGLAFSQQQANAHPGTRPASPTSTDVGDDSDDDSEDAMALAATAPSSGSFAAGVQMVAAPRLSYAPGTKTQGSGLAPSAVAAPVALRIACGWAENGPVVQNHIQELAVTAECGGARIGLGRAFPGWGRPGAYALVLIPEMCVGEDAFVPVPGRELLGDKFCPELIAPALDTGDIAYDEDGAMRVSARLWLKAKDLAAYKPHKELLRCRLVVTRCATPRAPAAVVAEGTTPAYRCYCKANTADRNAGGHGSTMRKAAPAPRQDRPKRKRALRARDESDGSDSEAEAPAPREGRPKRRCARRSFAESDESDFEP